MKTTVFAAAGMAACFALSCGTSEPEIPTSNVPGTDLFLDAPDGKYHGPMIRVELVPAEATFEVSQSQTFEAKGVFEDGTTIDVATHVAWNTDAPTIAATQDGAAVMGVAEGESLVKIQIGTLEATAKLTVVPAALVELEIVAETDTIPRRGAIRATAMGTYRDSRVEDVTAMVTWSTDAEGVLAVGQTEKSKGRLTGVANGAATVTVELEGVTATRSFNVECIYPAAPTNVQNQQVMPALSWTNAYMPGGGRGDFDMNQWFCDDDTFGAETALVFLISSGWCPNCPAYLQRVDAVYAQLRAAGAEVIIVEAETANYGPADTDYAQGHITPIIGTGTGIRVGDADTQPSADFIRRSPILQAFPSAWVVRRSDMKIVANQSDSNFYLDLVDIVNRIDWDWSDPDNPVPGFTAQCDEDAEESFEPNDTPAQAGIIGAEGAVVEGGICTEAADHYKIDMEGEWRLTLQFDNDVGNLDVYLWNEATNRPLRIGGELVGSLTDGDVETFTYTGSRMVVIEGRDNASAPYTLFVEPL